MTGSLLLRLDEATPRFLAATDTRTVEERKVLTAIARAGRPLHLEEAARDARLEMWRAGAALGRMHLDGLLATVPDVGWTFADPLMAAWAMARLGSCRDEALLERVATDGLPARGRDGRVSGR